MRAHVRLTFDGLQLLLAGGDEVRCYVGHTHESDCQKCDTWSIQSMSPWRSRMPLTRGCRRCGSCPLFVNNPTRNQLHQGAQSHPRNGRVTY